MKRTLVITLLLCVALESTASEVGSRSRPPRPVDAAELQLAIRKLRVVGSALYIAAHPDDENTAMLSWLSKGKLVRTGYLAMNRGSGGQNLIGSEKGELLGVIRTQELLEARRIDGAEQFFTRAIDFGYSKSPEETLEIWGRERILADMVWIIRRFRPDILITRFPPDGGGGHGHHTASAILAVEAFSAAGDPARFPEQLALVGPWQPRRIFWNAWRVDPANRPAEAPPLLSVDLGAWNPLLGRSYGEIAGESRSMHKSQGFGAPERRGTLLNYLELVAGDPAVEDPFEGVDLSWSRIPGGEAVDGHLAAALAAFDPEQPHAVLPHLLAALTQLREVEGPEWKREELEEVVRLAAGIWLEASAEEPGVTPGGNLNVTLTVINRSGFPAQIEFVRSRFQREPHWTETRGLRLNEPLEIELTLPIREDEDISHPFWIRYPHDGGAYTVHGQTLIGLPEEASSVTVDVLLSIGTDAITFRVPVLYRWTDRVEGELHRAVEIVPAVTSNPGSSLVVFPENGPKQVDVYVRSGRDSVAGNVKLDLPPGWKSDPVESSFRLEKKGEESVASFRVTPGAAAEKTTLSVIATTEPEQRHPLGMARIDYPHIPRQSLFPFAVADLVRVDVRTRGERIGYVMGSGDEVPEALRQIGYDVTLLTDEMLGGADLGRYDAIVVGVRAFNTRERLLVTRKRLFDYVAGGGTLVVQYNTLESRLQNMLGPWPFALSRDRVTVESAPVQILEPSHPLFQEPNRITADDFQSWIQERGLYFAGVWDEHYQPLLSMSDPGEESLRGSLLYAEYGRGVFIYTGLSFFRQLPAGVPGAYRLFANLVSAQSQRRVPPEDHR